MLETDTETSADLGPSPPTLTRVDLYQMVWAQPLSAVAERLGISRSGLAKICDRLLIPYPGRGHWTKRHRGSTPPALPPAPTPSSEFVTITAGRMPSRRSRTRLSPDQRRAQLLDTAAAIIVRDGLHAATTKGVAREAGISEAQAHNYFPRRADLLLSLARRELAGMDSERAMEVERGHDNLTRVTLSTVAYLRQVEARGALIQVLLNNPEVRAGLRAEREVQTRSARRRMTDRLNSRYGVPDDLAYGATAILTAVCLRAGRLLAEKKITLEMAERLSLAMVTAGNRRLTRAARQAGGS